MRTFATGATRDAEDGKYDYEGFLSPLVLERFAQYMHKHRKQADGKLRDSDNWQKGIPLAAYIKSAWRHFMDWWFAHRFGRLTREETEDALCALMFNVMGYLHEYLRGAQDVPGTTRQEPADNPPPAVPGLRTALEEVEHQRAERQQRVREMIASKILSGEIEVVLPPDTGHVIPPAPSQVGL